MQKSTSTYQSFNQISDTTTKRKFTRSDQNRPKSVTRGSKENLFLWKTGPQEARMQRTPKRRKQWYIQARCQTKRRRQTKIPPKTRV